MTDSPAVLSSMSMKSLPSSCSPPAPRKGSTYDDVKPIWYPYAAECHRDLSGSPLTSVCEYAWLPPCTQTIRNAVWPVAPDTHGPPEIGPVETVPASKPLPESKPPPASVDTEPESVDVEP